MTRSLYKGLQCSKSREEVEQRYSECNYEVNTEEVNPSPFKENYQASDYTVTWGGIDIAKGWGDDTFIEVLPATGSLLDELSKIPVKEVKPKRCEFNDCGWCYYKGEKSNDEGGQCNNSESCEVNDDV